MLLLLLLLPFETCRLPLTRTVTWPPPQHLARSADAVEISAWLLLLLLVLPSKATWQSCDTRLSPRHGQ